MRILIPITGSQGDVYPYVALGVGLQAAGHRVRLASHADFASFVRGRGLDFAAIADSSRALHESDVGKRMLAAGGNPFRFMSLFGRLRAPLTAEWLARGSEAGRDADLVVLPSTGFLLAHTLAEKLKVPSFSAHSIPLTPNRSWPSCLCPEAPAWLPGSRLYNFASHLAVGEFFWQVQRAVINRARQEVLGLPPLPFLGPPLRTFQGVPMVAGCSPHVLPRPTDWGDNQCLTGYWFLDRPTGWQPPGKLLDFLESGPPPVVIGFGSMPAEDPEEMTETILGALARSGQRGVLLTGWGGLAAAQSSDQVFVTASVPHDWLLSRAGLVVHHGGTGTTAAGLRAGVPAVIVPHAADQPFWGGRVYRLGVGPRPIPRAELTAERLAEAIQVAATDLGMRRRAAALGKQIRAEDGVGRAVEMFQRFVPAAEAGMYRSRGKAILLPQGVALQG